MRGGTVLMPLAGFQGKTGIAESKVDDACGEGVSHASFENLGAVLFIAWLLFRVNIKL